MIVGQDLEPRALQIMLSLKKLFPMKKQLSLTRILDDEIEKTLKLYKIKFRKIKNVCAVAAKSIRDKKKLLVGFRKTWNLRQICF